MRHQSTIHPDLLDAFQEAFDATSLDFTTVDDVEVQNGRNASAIARFDRAGRVHLKRMEGPGVDPVWWTSGYAAWSAAVVCCCSKVTGDCMSRAECRRVRL